MANTIEDLRNLTYQLETEQCLKAWLDRAPEGLCPAVFDGALCWGPQRPGHLSSQPCREEIHEVYYDTSKNATKFCDWSGVWHKSNYSNCLERDMIVSETLQMTELTTVLYSIGYTLSLVALCLALFIFIYFKEMRCLRNTIHTNLMLTYVLADFMWILSLTVQVSIHTDSISCLILFTLLHYFILTNFFWMFVEGLYLYMLVVETFTRENIGQRAYMAIGWGSPIPVIIVWIVARTNVHDPTVEMLGWSQCTLMIKNITDWIYIIPVLVVLVVNLIFLCMIMWVLITKLRSANNAETEQYRKGSKALLVLIPLLGITYILLIAGPNTPFYENVRAVLISTQGLLVGMLYCFLNTEVQNTLRHRWQRWREERSLANRAYAKDSSPNTRTESIRLYSRHEIVPYRKRESTGSETTTMTLVHGSAKVSNGPRSPFLQPPSEPV